MKEWREENGIINTNRITGTPHQYHSHHTTPPSQSLPLLFLTSHANSSHNSNPILNASIPPNLISIIALNSTIHYL